MSAQRKTWMGLALVVLAGAGVLALTAPEDETRFVSARAPSRKAGPDGGASRSARASGESSVATHGLGPTASAVAGSASRSPEPARVAAATGPAETQTQASGAAAKRNLFRPLVAPDKPALPPALMPLAPGELGGLLSLPDPRTPGAKRQREYWRYVGTVELDGATYALIEEKRSKAGAYVKQGDAFRGGHIRTVRPSYLIVAIAGQQYTLPKATGLEEEATPASPTPPNSGGPGGAGGAAPGQQPPGQQPPGQPGGDAASREGSPPAEGAGEAMPPTGWGGEGRRGRRSRRWGGF